ncbi:MAG: cell division protein SepF [Clostridia bacterium]|nr:cell division protein SepF [Clostridia bacterium]
MSAAIINKFKDMMGFGSQDDDYEEMEEYDTEVDEEYENEEGYSSTPRSRRSFKDIDDSNPYSGRTAQTKVIPMNNGMSASRMVITQPTCYDDVQEVGDYLKAKKSVIINLENVGKDDARRILDFLSGATFMIEGTIQKVSNLIYLMAPRTVEIQNDLEKSQYKQQKQSFSWLK